MKAAILALIVAISVSVWSYTKLQNRTGYGNAAATLKATSIIFIASFVVTFTIGLFLLGN